MDPLSRREFAQQTVGVAAVAATVGARKAVSANEKVVVGVMGLGGEEPTSPEVRGAKRCKRGLSVRC